MTDEQLAVLSRIAYLDLPLSLRPSPFVPVPYRTLEDLVSHFINNKPSDFVRGGYEKAFQMIMMCDILRNMQIIGYKNRNGSGGCGFVGMAFNIPDGGTVFAFRGTESFIDKRNYGSILFSGRFAEQIGTAQDFTYEFAKKSRPPFYATGHSLGGHIAKAVTIFPPPTMHKTSAFNAPGFSSSFFNNYRNQIERNSQRIRDIRNGSGRGIIQNWGRNVGEIVRISGSGHGMVNILNHYYRQMFREDSPTPPAFDSGNPFGDQPWRDPFGGIQPTAANYPNPTINFTSTAGGFIAGTLAGHLISGGGSQRIRYDLNGLHALSERMSSISSEHRELSNIFQTTAQSLDSQVLDRGGIRDAIQQINRRLGTQNERIDSYSQFVPNVINSMAETDGSLTQQSKGLQYKLRSIIARVNIMPNARPSIQSSPPFRVSSLMGQENVPTTDLSLLRSTINPKV